MRPPPSRERLCQAGDEVEESGAEGLGHVREVGEGVVLHELGGI